MSEGMRNFRSALVTGASGFLGSTLVAHLEKKGIEVICLARSKQRLLAACGSRYASLQGVRVIEVSSFEKANLKVALADVSVDVIFNLASYGVRPEDRDSEQLMEGNIGLTSHLLETAAEWPLRRFIHAGSCAEYGFPEAENKNVTESQLLRPTSPYGAAKAGAYLFANALASHLNIPFVALRLFGVFGPHEAPHRLVPYLISKLERDEPADLTPGEQVRDYLYEVDAAEAFIEAAGANLERGNVYNVCSGTPVRIRELGEAVADALQKPRSLLHWSGRPYRNDEPMWLVGDNRRFTSATAWRPRISLKEGVARMIEARQPTGMNRERKNGVR